jgi:hypothetical protein
VLSCRYEDETASSRPGVRGPRISRLSMGVKNRGETHAQSGFARDGEHRLAAMQESIASQVLPAASRDGFTAARNEHEIRGRSGWGQIASLYLSLRAVEDDGSPATV